MHATLNRFASDAGLNVSIVVPSIGRPELARTVTGAREAARATGLRYEIVVVDDSVNEAAAQLCRDLEDGSGDLRVAVSASRNIAIARNAGLDAAKGEWLAFIDDDEWPERDWLIRNLAVAVEFGADAVVGPVRAHYRSEAPRWVIIGDPYSRWQVARGSVMKRGSTANALVRRGALLRHGLRFGKEFGRSGGEDADLFGRLYGAGALICGGDGLVHEAVAIDRCSLRDLARRAIRVGQTYAQSETMERSLAFRIAFLTGAALKAAGFFAWAAVQLPLGPKYVLPRLQEAVRNLGKVAYLVGSTPIVYYRAGSPSESSGEVR